MADAGDIQAEYWWQREIVTVELDWLGDELCRRTGQPRTAAGTKGNTAHLNGGHRSQEWILRSLYCTNRSYTVQSGLTATQARHIAAFDFTPGNVVDMIAQSRRLIAAMKAGFLDEVLAIYCNVDGDRIVDGWNNVLDRAATSDSSHLWHWHLTLDRRHMTNRALMERIVSIALGDDMGGEYSDQVLRELTGGNALSEVYVRIRGPLPGDPEKGKPNGFSLTELHAKVDQLAEVVKAPAPVALTPADLATVITGVADALRPTLDALVAKVAAVPDAVADEQAERQKE